VVPVNLVRHSVRETRGVPAGESVLDWLVRRRGHELAGLLLVGELHLGAGSGGGKGRHLRRDARAEVTEVRLFPIRKSAPSGAWRPRSRWVLETEAGQMAVLGIRPGGRIEQDEDVSG